VAGTGICEYSTVNSACRSKLTSTGWRRVQGYRTDDWA
jgi:hypothetical protein